MLDFLVFLAILAGAEISPVERQKHLCERLDAYWDQMSLEAKFELSMGCSSVNGVRVFMTDRLQSVLTREMEQNNGK
jgi:CTP:phosphocholine cytidylyltransferase-like protein